MGAKTGSGRKRLGSEQFYPTQLLYSGFRLKNAVFLDWDGASTRPRSQEGKPTFEDLISDSMLDDDLQQYSLALITVL